MFRKFALMGVAVSSIVCLVGDPAFAQNFQPMGDNPANNNQYECIRFGNPKLNSILTINNKNGKQNTSSIRKAKRKFKTQIKKTSQRISTIKDNIRDLKKKRKKLQSKLPITFEPIEKLDASIAALELKVAGLIADREVLKVLRQKVGDCKKDVPIIGSLRTVSEVFKLGNSARFAASLVYEVDTRPAPGSIAAKVSGHTTSMNGFGGVFFNPPPHVSNLSVRDGFCVAQVNNDCLREISGHYVYFAGITGPQDPGTCGEAEPFRCSMEEALSKLNARASAIRIEIVGSSHHGGGHGHH